MIKLYLPSRSVPAHDFRELRSQGKAALKRHEWERAISFLSALVPHTDVRDEEYVEVLTLLQRAYVELEQYREALSITWYLKHSQELFLNRVPQNDRGRSLLGMALRETSQARTSLALEAAKALESAGQLVRAAIAFEVAEAWQEARALWSRLAQSLNSEKHDLYPAALAYFNLFLTSEKAGDAQAARAASTTAVHLLEEAADQLETSGQRERAFDCYQVLLAIGRRTNVFEHILEGYVNIIRILQEDHLRHYALQTYREIIEIAKHAGEFTAAATLCREMAVYARKEGEVHVSNQATLMEAELWQASAEATKQRRGSVQSMEHALLASMLALAEVGQFASVGIVYERLATLPLEEQRRNHYTKAHGRYLQARNELISNQSLNSSAMKSSEFPDVWHVDLLEWEEAGSPSEASATLLFEADSYGEVTRRRALYCRLVALAVEQPEVQDPAAFQMLCEVISRLELYSMLASLEKMATHPQGSVRAAALRAFSRFLYKRSFSTLRQALVDPDTQVLHEALVTLEQLSFPHAIDPLARILRETKDNRVQRACLRALAKIERAEAAELLLEVIAYGSNTERQMAMEALDRARGRVFFDVARQMLPNLEGTAQSTIKDLLFTRGYMAAHQSSLPNTPMSGG
jgi:tetratricopeptide (TPR) repeat protein